MLRFNTYHYTELTIRYCDTQRHVESLTKKCTVDKNAKFDITL